MAAHFKQGFKYIGGGSNKFWTVEVVGAYVLVTYGKRGTRGKTQPEDKGSTGAAMAYAHKKIKEKTDKGYVRDDSEHGADAALIASLKRQQGGGPSPPAARTPPPPPTPAASGGRFLDLDD